MQTCTISFADPDQGKLAGPPCDALIALGLARAQDLDDLPSRHELYALAREVNVFRVDPRQIVTWERTWSDGEYAPGVKYVSFVRRAPAVSSHVVEDAPVVLREVLPLVVPHGHVQAESVDEDERRRARGADHVHRQLGAIEGGQPMLGPVDTKHNL